MSILIWLGLFIVLVTPLILSIYLIVGETLLHERQLNANDIFFLIFSIVPLFNWIIFLFGVIEYTDGNETGVDKIKKMYNTKIKCLSCGLNNYKGYYNIHGDKCPQCGHSQYVKTNEPVVIAPKFTTWNVLKAKWVITKIKKQNLQNKNFDKINEQLKIYENLQKKKLDKYMKEQYERQND